MSIPVLFMLAVICGICFLVGIIFAIVFLATGKSRNGLISGMFALAMAASTVLCVSEAFDRAMESVDKVKGNFKELFDSLKIEQDRQDSLRDTVIHKDKTI